MCTCMEHKNTHAFHNTVNVFSDACIKLKHVHTHLHNHSYTTFANRSENNHNKDNNQEEQQYNKVDNEGKMSAYKKPSRIIIKCAQ